MQTVDFIKTLKKTLGLDNTIFPNALPDELETVTGVFVYDSKQSDYVPRGTIKYQFLTRSLSKETAEKTSSDLLIALDRFRHFSTPCFINQDCIEGISIKQYEPIYVGRDNASYLFSFDIQVYVATRLPQPKGK